MRTYLVLCFLVFPFLLSAQLSDFSEKEISDYIQSLIGGQREVSVAGGRVDLIQNDIAFEIEWANNWKESIGQSLFYSLQTNKKAGIILILKNKEDYKYFIQLNSTINHGNLSEQIEVFLFPNDFEELMKKE